MLHKISNCVLFGRAVGVVAQSALLPRLIDWQLAVSRATRSLDW